MKNGKTAGIDVIQAELLKTDFTTSTEAMYNLFNTIWDGNTIPNNWTKGLIVKLPNNM